MTIIFFYILLYQKLNFDSTIFGPANIGIFFPPNSTPVILKTDL